ncbi:restriction endonuclease subunit S [Lelliottia nimipressuralis]|uniref:Restriction endonuclease subunit S n=2 Tax=Lelliottia nimipressuralis TaxID=69220 RepID=A0ABY3P0H1_9ENTR|nr:restriction endonuclease subunit S [Lelliottia nimipressuralis]TYT32170.1 restriction endonuclease subunit S [Lelliottia nimipressuralis]
MVKLGDVCTINPRLPKNANPEQEVTFLAMAAVSEKGEISSQETRILHETKKGFTYFERGDVLLAKITPCFENGKATLTNSLNTQIGFGSTEFHVLRAIPELILPEYIFYLIWNEKFRITAVKEMTGSAGQKRVSANYLKEYKFYLPSILEQEKIVSALNKGYSIHRKRQQAIKLADDFLHTIFHEMFGDPVENPKGWKKDKIKKGVLNITSGWSATGENIPCKSDEFGVLKISSVTSGIFKPEENKVVDCETIPASKKLIFPKKGDLLFSRANTRELVAAICMVHQDYDNLFLPDKLWSIKLNHELLLPEFFLILIQNEKVRELLTKQATGTSGSMLNISKNKFEETEIIFPEINIQKDFCDTFRKTINLKAKLIKSNELAIESFNSLSQKVF